MRFLLLWSLGLLATLTSSGQGRYNDSLIRQLDTIAADDQVYRDRIDNVKDKYGAESKELKELWAAMRVTDSIDEIRVAAILDHYGWLGADILGDDGNATLFFVIQHSDLPMQVKYLPMLRDAVKQGRAKARHLALLEDRVALRQGREQVYGSQVGWDMKSNTYYVLPLEDPDSVDQRRLAVGLSSLDEYLQHWELHWDLAQYKKDLPKIEEFYRKAHI